MVPSKHKLHSHSKLRIQLQLLEHQRRHKHNQPHNRFQPNHAPSSIFSSHRSINRKHKRLSGLCCERSKRLRLYVAADFVCQRFNRLQRNDHVPSPAWILLLSSHANHKRFRLHHELLRVERRRNKPSEIDKHLRTDNVHCYLQDALNLPKPCGRSWHEWLQCRVLGKRYSSFSAWHSDKWRWIAYNLESRRCSRAKRRYDNGFWRLFQHSDIRWTHCFRCLRDRLQHDQRPKRLPTLKHIQVLSVASRSKEEISLRT